MEGWINMTQRKLSHHLTVVNEILGGFSLSFDHLRRLFGTWLSQGSSDSIESLLAWFSSSSQADGHVTYLVNGKLSFLQLSKFRREELEVLSGIAMCQSTIDGSQ